MYCRKCGNELHESDLFCNRCGTPVSQEQADAQNPGVTAVGKDSERVIEEFYRSNRRREETQAILNMEFANIKEGAKDLPDLSSFAGNHKYYFEAEKETAAQRRAQAEAEQPKVVDEPVEVDEPAAKVVDEPAAEVVEEVAKEAVEVAAEETALEVAAEPAEEAPAAKADPVASAAPAAPVAPVAPAAPDYTHVPAEPQAPKYASDMSNPVPHIFQVFKKKQKAQQAATQQAKPQFDLDALMQPREPRAPKYVGESSDSAPHMFQTQQPAAPTQPAQPAAPAPQPAQPAPTPAAPTPAVPQQAPAAPTPAAAQPAPTQPTPAPAQAAPSGITKPSISQEAQATLDFLDQLLADFDTPIGEAVGSTMGASAATTAAGAAAGTQASAPMGAAPTQTSTPASAAPLGTAPLSTVSRASMQHADLHKYAPATASGIATGKAIQKAVLDPEEEPPEEDFEDDDDFLSEEELAAKEAVKEAAKDAEKSEAAEAENKETKKEKKGLFRRKSKEESNLEDIKDEPEEERPSNVQKRSNVIVLNPEFLNDDEKASGKGTEDFKIASNMTHGVKAMERVDYEPPKDEDEHYPQRSSGVMRKVLMGVLTALLALAAAVSILITFGRDTAPGKAILEFWDNIKGVESENDPGQASEAELHEEGTEAGTEDEASTGQNEDNQNTEGQTSEAEETQPSEENKENTEGSEEGEPKRIINENFNAAEGGLGESIQSPELAMEVGREYPLDYFYEASIFVDSEWYKDENGESVTYNDAIFYMITDYYTKLIDRMNRDSEEVLDLIVPETKLMTDVSGIKSDAIVLHSITTMEVGEARRNDSYYYVIVRINEVTNDGRPASTYKRVIRLVPDEENHTFKADQIVVGD